MGHKQPRSPVDALTTRERVMVQARLANPNAALEEIGRTAGLTGTDKDVRREVSRAFRRPQVKAALATPPPTIEQTANFAGLSPAEQRSWLLGWYVKLVENPNTPQSERIRALNAIAEMTPGAKVPVGINHSGSWSLEQFVAAAGGKPSDAPDKFQN